MWVQITWAEEHTYSRRSRGYRHRVENRVAAWIRTRSTEDEDRDDWYYHFIGAGIVHARIVSAHHSSQSGYVTHYTVDVTADGETRRYHVPKNGRIV